MSIWLVAAVSLLLLVAVVALLLRGRVVVGPPGDQTWRQSEPPLTRLPLRGSDCGTNEHSWALTLAREVQRAASGEGSGVSRVVVSDPGSVDVWFRYRGDTVQRALRVSRGDFEAAELLSPERDPADRAAYVVLLGVEEPHADSDFDSDESGVLWLRPNAWVL